MNNNLCEFCETEPESNLVYDTGVCGKCGVNAECCDRELISFYRVLGLSDEFITRKLPRLRFYAPFGNYGHKNILSIADIGVALLKHITVTVDSLAEVE